MTREIKFRAWDTREGLQRMHYLTGGFVKYGEGWNGGEPKHKFYELHSNLGYSKVSADETILMQFTSLKDKNGKEIYEGDIIAWDYEYDADYDGDMPIVKRSAGRAVVKDIFDTTRIRMAAQESKGCEVIGNIYENPELLK